MMRSKRIKSVIGCDKTSTAYMHHTGDSKQGGDTAVWDAEDQTAHSKQSSRMVMAGSKTWEEKIKVEILPQKGKEVTRLVVKSMKTNIQR